MPIKSSEAQEKEQSFSQAWGWGDEAQAQGFGLRGIARAENPEESQRARNQAAARAARQDDEASLSEWIKSGANPLSRVMGRELAMAAERGSQRIVELMLSHGADASEFVGLALKACARRGFDNFEIALLLARSQGVWLDSGAMEAALAAACRDDSLLALARELIALGANPNGVAPGEKNLAPPTGESPLELAAHRSAHAALRLLIDSGAKEHLNAALACALSMAAWESARILEGAGAKIDECSVLIAMQTEEPAASERAARWMLDRGVSAERVAAASLSTGFENWGAFEAALDRGARGQNPRSPWRAHWERSAKEGGALARKANEIFRRLADKERAELLADQGPVETLGGDRGESQSAEKGEGSSEGSGASGRGARRL